ncbi:MAG: 50S ribosomal protein L24, partial [Patescibacteria group bacterium]
KIKKGDTVIIIAGKDRGKTGRVIRVFPSQHGISGKILVEGVALRKRHRRPKKAGQKGEVIETSFPIASSNAMIFCKSCKKGIRVAYQTNSNNGKKRICRKCKSEI